MKALSFWKEIIGDQFNRLEQLISDRKFALACSTVKGTELNKTEDRFPPSVLRSMRPSSILWRPSPVPSLAHRVSRVLIVPFRLQLIAGLANV